MICIISINLYSYKSIFWYSNQMLLIKFIQYMQAKYDEVINYIISKQVFSENWFLKI